MIDFDIFVDSAQTEKIL